MAATTRRRRRSSYALLPRWVRGRRIAAAVAALAVLFVGAYGLRTVLALAHLFRESPVSVIRQLLPGGHGGSAVAAQFNNGQRINIALYGYGGSGHDGAYLTDSIMVVSIQPRGDGKAQIAEIGIPRDWWAPLDLGNGHSAFGRINEAYEDGMGQGPHPSSVFTGDHGGGNMADATLERMLGIHIDHFIGIDFTAFKTAVDSVGGIDVNVEHTFTDYKYPRGECQGAHPDCGYVTVHFDAGREHMDGSRALIFARSRESADPQEGSNFARNKRQQLVLTAVKQKVLSLGGLRNLPGLLNSLGDHVITDLQLDDALSFYDLVKDVDTKSIVHVSIDNTNFIYECGYPTNCDSAIEYPHDRTFASIHHFVSSIFVDPAVIAERAPVSVVDASGRGQGASARWTQLLGEVGLPASDGGTGRTAATTRVIDSSGGHDARTAAWLAKYFGVQVEAGTQTAAPSRPGTATTAPERSTSGVTLILGQDEEGTFNSTAPSPYSGYFGNVSGDTAYTGATTGYTPAPRRSSPPPSAGATPPQPSAPPSAPPHKPAPTPPPTPCPILVCPH